MGDDQGRLLHSRDDIGHREGLARAGHAEQDLIPVTAVQPVHEGGDGLG